MNTLKFTCLLIIFVLGLTAVNAQESDANVAITLERTACFGACPIYTVSILEDGTVIYNGEKFVEITGEQTSEIDSETVALMVEAFEKVGYFDWEETYDTMMITDQPTVITSVTHNGKTHRITRYDGDTTAPLALPFLAQWIDQMVNTQMWTGAQPNIAGISNGTDTAIITLQRTQCYGACPVYSVVVFENGTTVYTGIAHVNQIGVHIFEAEASAVTSIAQRAQIFGYFNWQDSYEDYMMTDQATVTTSVRWEDQFKSIVRYEGDPSAPVGLTWVEDIIDLLVTDMVG